MGTYQAYVNWNNDEEKKSCMSLRADLAQLGCKLGQVLDASSSPFGKSSYVVTYDDSIREQVEAKCNEKRSGGSVYAAEINEKVQQSVSDGTARPEAVHDLLSSNQRGKWLGPELSARPEFVRDEYESKVSRDESDKSQGVTNPSTYPDGEKRMYGGIYGQNSVGYEKKSDLSYSINVCQAITDRLNDKSSWRGSVSDYIADLKSSDKYQWPQAKETVDYVQSLIDDNRLSVEEMRTKLQELVDKYRKEA